MNFRTAFLSNFLSRCYVFLLYLIIIVVSLISSKVFKFPFQIPKYLSLEFLIILLSLTLFISIIIKVKLQFSFNIFDLSIFFRIIIIFVLTFFSVKSDNSFFVLSVLLLLTIFYFLLRLIFTFNLDYTFKIILNISKIFLAVAIIEVIIIVFNNHSTIFAFDIFLHSKKILFKGTFGNPNWVSGYLVAISPFLFLLVSQSKTKSFKYFYTIVVTIVLLFILLSQSRGAWIALFIGIVYYFAPTIQLFVKRYLNKKIFFLVFLGFIIFSSVFILNKLYRMNSISADGRIFVWKVTALMIADKPLTGIGYGNYFHKFLDYQKRFFGEPENKKYLSHAGTLRQSHNEYLQIFAETGIIGLSIFLIIIFFVFYNGIKLLNEVKQLEHEIIRISLTSIIIILTHSFVDTPLHNVIPIYLLLFLDITVISHFWSLHLITNEKKLGAKSFWLNNSVIKLNYTFSLSRNTKFILSCCVICLTLFLITNTVRKVRAYYFWQKGISYVNNENWNEAIVEYKKAIIILHDKGELKFTEVSSYVHIISD